MIRDLLAAVGAYTILTFLVMGAVLRFSRRAVRRQATDPWQRLLNRRRPAVLQQDWN